MSALVGGFSVLTSPAKPTSDSLTVRRLTLPWSEEDRSEPFICVIENVLDKAECDALIALSEKEGYSAALLNDSLAEDVRKSDRAMVDSPAIVENLYQKILKNLNSCEQGQPLLSELIHATFRQRLSAPQTSGSVYALGLNERMRFLRYDKGAYFLPHRDGCYLRKGNDKGGKARKGEVSFVTCQVYLNEGFEGGATRFINPQNEAQYVDYVPRTGSVLLFDHNLLHEGCILSGGRKYTIRTDVMYATKQAVAGSGVEDLQSLTYQRIPIPETIVGGGMNDGYTTP